MTRADINPIVDLVRMAMATGVLMALEDKASLISKLQAVGAAGGSFPDALTADAEDFVRTRWDLIEAINPDRNT